MFSGPFLFKNSWENQQETETDRSISMGVYTAVIYRD